MCSFDLYRAAVFFLMMPILAGQPERNAEEVQWELAQANPPVAHEEDSDEQPLALIAYTRPLA